MFAPPQLSRKRKLEMTDSPQMPKRQQKRQKLTMKAPIVDLTSDTEETMANAQSTISLLCPHRSHAQTIRHTTAMDKTASPISPTPSLAAHRGHNYSIFDTQKQAQITTDEIRTEHTPDGEGNDVPMPILNEDYADHDEVISTGVPSRHVEHSTKKTSQKPSTQSTRLNAESDSGAVYLKSKCCQQMRLQNECAFCDQCGDVLCPNSACKQNVMCDACGYFSAEQNLCTKCDQSTVHNFSCIECGETHQQCDSCFVECTHCYTNGIAKVCWNCQSYCVSLICTHCQSGATLTEMELDEEQEQEEDEMDDQDGELQQSSKPQQQQQVLSTREWKVEHRSCVAVDWQSMFERCCSHINECPRYICTQCLYEASFVIGDRTAYHPSQDCGRFVNCSLCGTDNEYFCNKHEHIHCIHKHD